MKEKKDVQAVNAVIKACIANADQLLGSAKEIRKPGRNHIAYHLATLALEEVGKANMIFMGFVTPERGLAEDEERSPADFIDDHAKKLFWSVWSPTFTSAKMGIEEFRRSKEIARKIHDTRLAALYVDPNKRGRVEPTEEALDALTQLAEANLEMSRLKEIREPDSSSRQELEWFVQAVDNPQPQPIIFSVESFNKLHELELKGDARPWVAWLKQTIATMEQTSREIMEREMNRAEPTGAEARKRKWQINVRFKSWSHSMRAKPLSDWNKKSRWIKFFPNTEKKNEILVQFTLQKTIPAQHLWQAGMDMSSTILLALNIGTVGFFWWYLPTFVSKFCEQILDLESGAKISAERTPPLVIAWPQQALKDQQLYTISIVLAHLIQLDENRRVAYRKYLQNLGMLAKNDIFGQFEHTIIVGFYEALRLAMASYGDWDGDPKTFETAADRCITSSLAEGEPRPHLQETLRFCSELAIEKEPNAKATLNEVAKMKIYCDIYFVKKASEWMTAEKEKEKRQTV